MRIAVGGAFVNGGLRIALDASLNFPRDAKVAYDAHAAKIEGVPTVKPPPDQIIPMGFQPNLNLGVEFAIAKEKVLGLGAFTDFSSVTAKGSKQNGADHADMFGGSIALGLLGKQSRGFVGLSFDYGTASTKVPTGTYTLEQALATGFATDSRSTSTHWTLAGMLGSNYSFLKE